MEAPAQQADDAAWLAGLFARGVRPDRRRPLPEWAEAERYLVDDGRELRWRNSVVPYLIEPMHYAGLTCSTPRVSVVGASQVAKTMLGVNLAGQCLTETPVGMMIALPSTTTVFGYNRDKLDPMIQASPAVRAVVADVTERSGAGSTTKVKKGARGAQVELVTASSSRDLQMRSVQVVVMEELAEYDEDVGGRGSPEEQLEARTNAYRKRRYKIVKLSTPGIKGRCRITKAVEAGSNGRYHAVCPSCRHKQVLKFENLVWEKGKPKTAAYRCDACRELAQEHQKAWMLAPENGACWVHEHPERLDEHASFGGLSALYSNFKPWSDVAAEMEAVAADPSRAKVFVQQTQGEPWDEAFDLPKAEILMGRRGNWAVGKVPPGVLFLTGATDVQGTWLEWAVWGFDRNFGQWLIATGIIQGDPSQPEVWKLHSGVMDRVWVDAWGREVRPRSWGIDSSFLSSHVYGYVLERAGRHEFPVLALDGRDGWKLPPIGKESWRRIRRPGQEHLPEERLPKVPIYPVGTWDQKSELATALRLTEVGPGPEGWPVGALRFNEQVDQAWIEQLLAERFVQDPKTGVRSWKRLAARNEAWDLAVYCRAQARAMAIGVTEAEWDALIAETQGPPEKAQSDLLDMITPTLKAQAEAAAAAKIAEAEAKARADAVVASRPQPRTAEDRLFDGAEDFWGED